MAHRPQQLAPALRDLSLYCAYLASPLRLWARLSGGRFSNRTLAKINRETRVYPSNHNYVIHGRELVKSFQLFKRARAVQALYPEAMTSFLDIGCCRGYYVIEAGRRPACRAAVGIDVHEPFLATSRKVSEYIGASNAAFHNLTIDQLAPSVAAYGGPFQTVLLIGAYHYLYWGSSLCSHGNRGHQKIIDLLDAICSERLILSARLEVSDLPSYLREAAKEDPAAAAQYTTEHFLQAARERFTVTEHGALGTYPVYLLRK